MASSGCGHVAIATRSSLLILLVLGLSQCQLRGAPSPSATVAVRSVQRSQAEPKPEYQKNRLGFSIRSQRPSNTSRTRHYISQIDPTQDETISQLAVRSGDELLIIDCISVVGLSAKEVNGMFESLGNETVLAYRRNTRKKGYYQYTVVKASYRRKQKRGKRTRRNASYGWTTDSLQTIAGGNAGFYIYMSELDGIVLKSVSHPQKAIRWMPNKLFLGGGQDFFDATVHLYFYFLLPPDPWAPGTLLTSIFKPESPGAFLYRSTPSGNEVESMVGSLNRYYPTATVLFWYVPRYTSHKVTFASASDYNEYVTVNGSEYFHLSDDFYDPQVQFDFLYFNNGQRANVERDQTCPLLKSTGNIEE